MLFSNPSKKGSIAVLFKICHRELLFVGNELVGMEKKVRSEFGLNKSQTETVDIFVQFYSLNYSQRKFQNCLFRHSSQVEPIPNDNKKKQHIVIAIH